MAASPPGLVTLLSQQRLGRPRWPEASVSADSIGSGRIHWATCATGTTPLLKPTGHRRTGARSGGLPGAGVAPLPREPGLWLQAAHAL